MFEPIASFPIHEIEPEDVAYRGAWHGDVLQDSAGQVAVLRGLAGFVPGYFSGDFVTRVDLACSDLTEAVARAERFCVQMCT